ncbi:MAG: fumarate reductase subunit C [Candidatus Accumulibacter sp.]|jgi:fumarate reductase subunit C|nr:fumarate reductase subunit C [Accumulibacter sp.]
MSKRRPYIRSMDGWWKKNPYFVEYVVHESTALFVLAYALILLAGLVRLGQGEAAWNAWLECMKSVPALVVHLILLVSVVYHTYTWFHLMPVTLPTIRVCGRELKAGEIVKGGLVASVVASIVVFASIRGLLS